MQRKKGFAEILLLGFFVVAVLFFSGGKIPQQMQTTTTVPVTAGCTNVCGFGMSQMPYPNCQCYWGLPPVTTTTVPGDQTTTTTVSTNNDATCAQEAQNLGYANSYYSASYDTAQCDNKANVECSRYGLTVDASHYNQYTDCCKWNCKGVGTTTTTTPTTTTTVYTPPKGVWYCCYYLKTYKGCYQDACPKGWTASKGYYLSEKECMKACGIEPTTTTTTTTTTVPQDTCYDSNPSDPTGTIKGYCKITYASGGSTTWYDTCGWGGHQEFYCEGIECKWTVVYCDQLCAGGYCDNSLPEPVGVCACP